MTTDHEQLEDEVFDLVSITSLTRSEIISLLKRVAARIEAIPTERAANVEDGDDMGEGWEDERADPRDEPESPGWYWDEDGAHKY